MLDSHPAASNRCDKAAEEILPVAQQIDADARTRKLVPLEGRFLSPKMGLRWWYHVAVHVQEHVVDALTGADGTPTASYRDQHFKYPESIAWEDELTGVKQ